METCTFKLRGEEHRLPPQAWHLWFLGTLLPAESRQKQSLEPEWNSRPSEINQSKPKRGSYQVEGGFLGCLCQFVRVPLHWTPWLALHLLCGGWEGRKIGCGCCVWAFTMCLDRPSTGIWYFITTGCIIVKRTKNVKPEVQVSSRIYCYIIPWQFTC